MTEDRRGADARALREAFDLGFADAPTVAATDAQRLVLGRVGSTGFAARPGGILGVQRCPPITSVPGGTPTLLGLVARRGRIVGVHSLPRMLGLDPIAARPRWMFLAGDGSLGLAFETLEGHADVDDSALAAPPERGDGFTVGILREAGVARLVIDIVAIVRALVGGATST